MRNSFILFLLCALCGISSQAAVICVGASSSGNGSGSDWNNQAQWSSVTLTRGNVYYLADGTYAGKTFSVANSSTTTIEIRKAIVGDSTVEGITGWSSTLGDGQATFSSGCTFTTSYWIFDGMKGGGWAGGAPDKTASNYGFTFGTSTFPLNVANSGATITSVTLSHISATAPTSDVEKHFIRTANDTALVNNLTVSYCYAYGYNNFTWGTSAGLSHDGWIHEHNVFLDVHSSAAHHGEQFNNNFSKIQNWHVRYNWIEGIYDTQPTMIIGALNNDAGPYYIYGNVFKDLTFADGGICAVNNGFGAHDLSGGVYNNTFVNCESEYSSVSIVGGAGNNTMLAQNNIFTDGNYYESTSGTFSHNAYYNCATKPSESNQQTFGGDPFTGSNYALAGATTAGTTLASPFNVDAAGNTRGADGTWDRGALEFGSGEEDETDPTVTITTPTSSATYSTGSSTLDFGGTASDNVGVAAVGWENQTTMASGSATGTTTWSVTGIALDEGENVIVFTATDAASNAGVDTITVTRTTPPASPKVALGGRVTLGGRVQ